MIFAGGSETKHVVYILGYSTPNHFQPTDATLNYEIAESWIAKLTQYGENTKHVYQRIEFEP